MPKREQQRRIDAHEANVYSGVGSGGVPTTRDHGHTGSGDGGTLSGYAASDHEHDIDTIQEFLVDPDASTGLNAYIWGGTFRDDTTVTTIADASYSLTDNATNYIEIDATGGTISINTSSFTAGNIPIAEIVTLSGDITTITDKRAFFAASVGSASGDMLKSVYDTDDDGQVESADEADALSGAAGASASEYYGKDSGGSVGFHGLAANHNHAGTYSPVGHTHTESDITDLDHDAVKLQGRTLAATAPSSGQVVKWNGSQWEPGDPVTTRWEPLTNGDAASPALVYAAGDVIMVEVAL